MEAEEMLDDLDLAWEEQEPGRRRGAQPTRQVRQRRRKERKRRRRSFGALFISLVMLAGLGFGVYWGVGKVQDYFGAADYDTNPATTSVLVKIEKGDLPADMGQRLVEKDVVKSVKAFVAAADANEKSRTIQAGTYKLWQKMPAKEALLMLLNPGKNLVSNGILIPEGKTVIDTFGILSKATGIPVADFEKAAQDPVKNLGVPEAWFQRTDGKKAIVSVEGFLFPDTYAFDEGMTATQILTSMVNEFLHVADDIKFIDTVHNTLQISPHEALVVASLAQVEAGKNEDMPKVARVAYNRAVKPGFACQCLQFDVTVNYWLQKQGKPTKASKDMLATELDDLKNPYNTGPSSKGLPPGPISNPGKAALEGAMAPPAAKWIYFVATDKSGTTKFSDNDAQFQRDKAEACRNGVLTCP